MTIEQHRRNLFIILVVICLGLTALALLSGATGPEIWILLLIAVPLSVVAVVIYRTKTTPLIRLAELDGIEVGMTPAQLSRECQLRLGGLSNVTTRVDGAGPNLTVSRTHFPGWSIAVAILFFPLGLLALLAKRTESTTLMFLEVKPPPDPVSTLRIGGYMTRAMTKALQFPEAGRASTSPSPSSVAPNAAHQTPALAPPAFLETPSAAPSVPPAGAPPPQAPAGWFPDPHGRYEQRYWDGASWTNSVLVDGVSIFEPGTT